jgi:lysophospholipase L1-like esterase
MKHLHLKLATIFASTLIALAGAELVARRTYGEGFRMLVDPYEDHTYRPMLEYEQVNAGRTVRFFTNSLGWKDGRPGRVVEKRPEARRIVFLGDSFTEGLGLAHEHTIPAVVERRLAAEGERVEALNGGRASFSPLLEYQRLKRFFGDGYRADVVVVLFDLSDVQDEILYAPRYEFSETGEPLRLSGWRNHPLLRGLYNRSALVRSLSRLSHGTAAPGAAIAAPAPEPPREIPPDLRPDGPPIPPERVLSMPPLAFRTLRANWMGHRPSLEGWVREGFHRGLGNLERLEELAAANGARVLLVLYPWPTLLYGRDDPRTYAVLRRTFGDFYADRELVYGTRPSPRETEYQARMHRFCRERGLPLVDLVPQFQEVPEWHRLFLPGDVHFNERGSRLAGARIARQVLPLLREP